MTRKLKVLTLILVTLSIVFGTQVAASLPIARPDVMYPEHDFSLDNPEVVRQIEALLVSLRDQDLQIIGPFYQYYVNNDGTMELKAANYNVFLPDGTPNLVTMFISSHGSLCGMAAFNASSLSDFVNENHYIIGNEDITYIVTSSGISELSEYCVKNPDSEAVAMSQTLVAQIIDSSSWYLLSSSDTRNVVLQKKMDTSDNEVVKYGSELPIVYMGSGSCYSASTASIVKFREPDVFSDLTSTNVIFKGKDRNEDYIDTNLVTVDLMYDVMVKDYLNNGNLRHYTVSYDISDKAMSQSSYKSIISNGCVMLGIFRKTDLALSHVVALCQYSEENDIVTAYCMEPMDGTIKALNWVDGFMHCRTGWVDAYLRDHITSYY